VTVERPRTPLRAGSRPTDEEVGGTSRLSHRIGVQPIYARNLAVAESAGLLTLSRRALGVFCWVYAAGLVLSTLTPVGPAAGWPRAIVLICAAVSVAVGLRWWLRDWPPARQSLATAFAADLANTVVLLLFQSSFLGLVGTLWMAIPGAHLVLAHGRLAMLAHCSWATLTILYFATASTQRANANIPLVVFTAITLFALLVGLPWLRHRSIEVLRDDSRQAAALADRDPLTGALNQRGVQAAIPRLISTSQPGDDQLVMVILDLDRFKSLNDTYGHHRGDQILAEVSERLIGSVRRTALVARTGGEEFAVIDTIAAHTYTTYGERLLAAVREAGGDLTVTASVGIAWMPLLRFALAEPASALDGLRVRADQAMYAAKRTGGDSMWIADHDTRG